MKIPSNYTPTHEYIWSDDLDMSIEEAIFINELILEIYTDSKMKKELKKEIRILEDRYFEVHILES